VAGRIRSIEKSNDSIGNRLRYLPACSIEAQENHSSRPIVTSVDLSKLLPARCNVYISHSLSNFPECFIVIILQFVFLFKECDRVSHSNKTTNFMYIVQQGCLISNH
jgi:hypothetical protein